MALLIAAVCIVAISCAPQTKIVKLYDSRTDSQVAYSRFLVVAISSDYEQRNELENRIVSNLRREGVTAVPGYSAITRSDSGGVLQEEINSASDRTGSDAILITHVASVDSQFKVEEGREELMSECRGGDPLDYFLYDHSMLKEPDTVKVAHTVVVITSAYDAKTRQRLWTIQSTCFEKSSMAEVLIDEASAIVNQLRIDELI